MKTQYNNQPPVSTMLTLKIENRKQFRHRWTKTPPPPPRVPPHEFRTPNTFCLALLPAHACLSFPRGTFIYLLCGRQGHIALARAVFPEDTMGSKLDVLARLSLWEAGLDYRHGTGHGALRVCVCLHVRLCVYHSHENSYGFPYKLACALFYCLQDVIG